MATHRGHRAGGALACVWLALGVLLGAVVAVRAQVEVYRVGQGGSTWDSQADTRVGAVSVSGALQPLQITPGDNLMALFTRFGQAWQNSAPPDYTVGGLPRAWSNSFGFNNQRDGGPLKLVDGIDTTATGTYFKSSGNPKGTAFFFDLGAAYPLNRLRFFPPPADPFGYMRAFDVSYSDGKSFSESGQPEYEMLWQVPSNDQQVVEFSFATENVRFLQIRNQALSPFNLAEVELYGHGFVPAASYVSQLHRFDQPVNTGSLRVVATRLSGGTAPAKEPPSCTVQVRNGATAEPLMFFRRDLETGDQVRVSRAAYDSLPRVGFFRIVPNDSVAIVGAGVVEVPSKDAYQQLPVDQQGPIRDFAKGDVRADGENWSPWSVPVRIDSTGTYETDLGLPSPRQYLQFRASFSGNADNAIGLNAFRMEYWPPIATSAVGELGLASGAVPPGGVIALPSGTDTSLVCDVRAEFADDTLEGFAGVQVGAFPAPRFAGLRVGGRDTTVVPEPTADGFVVRFAPMGRRSNQPIQIAFRQELLESNTPVRVWLLGTRSGLRQPVAALRADAMTLYSVDPEPQFRVAVAPTILTPNRDGINDSAEVSCTLIQLAGEIQVRIAIIDLSGRPVRQLLDQALGAGVYRFAWDGRDDSGVTVAPGAYVCRVKGESQSRTFTAARVVGVAY